MFSLNEYISYYLYPRYIDMNKGIECLSELIRSQMNANPLSGDAFLFFGKKKDMVKVLRWDTDGFILYQKRLEEGTFELPRFKSSQGLCKLEWEIFFMIMKGISPRSVLRFFVKFGGTSSIVNKESWLSVVYFLPYCTSAFLPL